MSVLTQKLEEASKLFQSHNFKKSLQAYEDCVKFCRKTQQERSIIHNILSTQATLEYVLGDFDKALATLNSILNKDPSHFLSLLRRSQVYKKKGKLVKALRDLQRIFVFCPDNLQISAFKVEIQHLLMKQGSNIEQLSDSEDDDEDEEELLAVNFMNLKQIDRKSSDLSAIKAASVQRKSRVTISGDTFIEYDREDTNDTKEDDNEIVSDKDLRTMKEIQLDNDLSNDGIPAININVIAPKKPKRSILKNKGTSIFIAPEDSEAKTERYMGRESKLLSMLKSIDGKVIAASDNSLPGQLNEVKFRKSISQGTPLELIMDEEIPSPSPSKKSGFSTLSKRKSCLKGASFDIPEPKMRSRSSKFDLMDVAQVDGKVLQQKRRMSKELVKDEKGEKGGESESDNESSSHNIFGDRNFEMTEELKNQLGFSQEAEASPSPSPNKLGVTTSMNMKKKCSILKKSSMTIQKKDSTRDSGLGGTEGLGGSGIGGIGGLIKLKSKKSVMFNCTM